MTQTTHTISPLRQRMLDDMRLRKLSPKTHTVYIRAVKRLAGFLCRSTDTATVEDLRRFKLYLVGHGASPITLNATITGSRSFSITLDRAGLIARLGPLVVRIRPQKVASAGAFFFVALQKTELETKPQYVFLRDARRKAGLLPKMDNRMQRPDGFAGNQDERLEGLLWQRRAAVARQD
jgi:hypothetical protein